MLPPEILTLQHWFASIITRPIDSDSRMMPISPSGRQMSDEAKEYIAPNSKLASDQRIEIYNQQYWWRLLTILQHHFPTLTRLFGYNDFNTTFGFPFLKAPSRNWSIGNLGEDLPNWIEHNYSAKDKPLVLAAAEVDWAYNKLFVAAQPIAVKASVDLLTKKLSLQKHVQLFCYPFDVLTFRKELLKESVDYWTDADFPILLKERSYCFILWRDRQNQLIFKEIEEGQWTLLNLISDGLTIEEASEFLEKRGGRPYEEALSSFQDWIPVWIQEQFLKEKTTC
ncbi:MAG: putative DNA-binding domain-containing protein [Verrucomicrobia bacterium]|nr:putative DNA-binding domain-containing protein [Verrucomicrobiota bacterium]